MRSCLESFNNPFKAKRAIVDASALTFRRSTFFTHDVFCVSLAQYTAIVSQNEWSAVFFAKLEPLFKVI
jgi:hypothetical protein